MASPFSGKAGRNAAMWTAGYLQQLEPKILDQLAQGKTEALGYLGGGREDITGGYGEALAGMERYYGKGADAYREAVGALKPVQAEAMKGYGMLSNALGLGGAEGNAAARAAYQTGPGYEWATSQATEAANRRAKQLGLLSSGNAQAAEVELAKNLADQDFGKWIANLQPYQTQAGTMATNEAQTLANLGNLYGQAGRDYSTLRADEAAKLAGIGTQQAGVATGTAEAGAGVMSNIGGQIAQVGQQGMMAGQQAAANRFSALSGGLQMAGQALGGFMGLGVPGGGTIGGKLASNFFGGIFGGGAK